MKAIGNSGMSIYAQFFRFAGIGAISTGIQYIILICLVAFFATESTLASTVGYVISALVNYQLNRSVTFKSNARHLDALPRFVLTATIGLSLNAAVLWSATTVLDMHYLIGQLFATAIALIWNFLVNRIWTFSQT